MWRRRRRPIVAGYSTFPALFRFRKPLGSMKIGEIEIPKKLSLLVEIAVTK